MQERCKFSRTIGGTGGSILSYGLITDEVGIEDASSRGGQVGSFTQVADDHAIKFQNSRRDLQKLRSNPEHRAELAELGPAGPRDQVGQDISVAVEVGDAKAPVERTPLG